MVPHCDVLTAEALEALLDEPPDAALPPAPPPLPQAATISIVATAPRAAKGRAPGA
ncbi:MAG: hypothetical protein ACM32E_24345 [Gemmatimonadota bacterium]